MGALTGTLGAALLDFQRSDRPIGALVNSASPGLGLALGALGAGLVVAVRRRRPPTGCSASSPSPSCWRRAACCCSRSPPRAVRGRWPRCARRCTCRTRSGGTSSSCCPCLVATWALGGLYLALGPSLADEVFGLENDLAGALLILAMHGTAAIGRSWPAGCRAERAMVVGALVFAVGVTGTVGVPADRLGRGVLRRRGGLGPRLRCGLPGRPRDGDPRRRPRATGPACCPASSSSAICPSASRRCWPGSPPRRSGCRPRPSSTARVVVVPRAGHRGRSALRRRSRRAAGRRGGRALRGRRRLTAVLSSPG